MAAGAGDFNVSVKPTVTSGYLVISPNNTTLREIVFYSDVGTNAYGDYIRIAAAGDRGKGGTTAQTHSIGEAVRMNITAEHWQELQDDIADIIAAGAPDASITTKGLVEEATESEIEAGTATGGTGAKLFIPPDKMDSISKSKVITLSSADILALFVTPKELIAAPGAGKVVVIDNVLLSFTYGGVAYTGGGDMRIVYRGNTTNLTATAFQNSTFNQANNNLEYAVALRNVSYTGPGGIAANTAIDLYNISAAFTAGNGTAKISINYRIVTL